MSYRAFLDLKSKKLKLIEVEEIIWVMSSSEKYG